MPSPAVRTVAHTDPVAVLLLREYLTEIVGRYHGTPVTPAQVDAELGEQPCADLAAVLVAELAGRPVGCAGVRLRPGYAELKRLYVRPAARGSGVGAMLVTAAERHARGLGATLLRLDTRSDLVESRRLYARLGYREIPGYGPRRYAEHWFEKALQPDQ